MLTTSATIAVALALTGTCTPADAWDETVPVLPAVAAVPAVGTPTLTIPNPDYVPAVPGTDEVLEQSRVVHHDAVGAPMLTIANPDYIPAVHHDAIPDEVVHHDAVVEHHDAVTRTEWKYSKHGGQGEVWVANDTFKYVDAQGNGSNTKPKKGDYYERTQKTRTVTVCDAWDEVLVEAWDETIPGTPAWDESAVGEPTIEVANPDYVEAWDETLVDVPYQAAVPGVPAEGDPTIEVPNPAYVPAVEDVPAVTRLEHHPAVVCTVESPATDPEPAVEAPVKRVEAIAPAFYIANPAYQDAVLAETGGDFQAGWLIGGGALLALGVGFCFVGMGATRHHRQ